MNASLNQWSTGSGFWSPIRPDIKFFWIWIGYRFPFNRIRILRIKWNLTVQKSSYGRIS